MHEEIEEVFFDDYPEYTCELDKSWDAMHRMLTDGNLNFENKFQPLCNVIFGGEFLYGLVREPSGEVITPQEEDDEFMILKTPEQVAEIAKILPERTKAECRECYDKIDEEDYGFALDDERLKNLGGGGYFKELLERIRDIRASEKVFYRQVLEIYATSIDYDPKAEISILFFKKVQNKIHYAIHGQTAAEVVYTRADAEKDFMWLTTFVGNQPTLKEAVIAKNYLSEKELRAVGHL